MRVGAQKLFRLLVGKRTASKLTNRLVLPIPRMGDTMGCPREGEEESGLLSGLVKWWPSVNATNLQSLALVVMVVRVEGEVEASGIGSGVEV